jgi:hypothetical protein
MERQKAKGKKQKAETAETEVPDAEKPSVAGFIEDVESAADDGMLDEPAKVFDPENPDLQPGEIVDREGYEAAINDGSIGEIPERNIVYIGEGEPATAYHGAFKVTLPDAETQRRGFYHPQARQIIQHLPRKYKRFVKKGE